MFISVIIPTHNRCNRVQKAVESVLHQTHRDLDLIVVDDGSDDGTGPALARYQDSRFKYHKIPHGGVACARNFGARQAQADWLCFLDSDDVWMKDKLAEQVRFHREHPEFLISQTDDVWFRHGRRVNKKKIHMVRDGFLFPDSLRRCLVCASSVMLKRELFLQVGGFDEFLPVCEDYDLWLRILARNPVGFVKKPLVIKYGGHADQLSRKYPAMDRFRVYVLKKLLGLGVLSEEQREMVHVEIEFKAGILQKGARAREDLAMGRLGDFAQG